MSNFEIMAKIEIDSKIITMPQLLDNLNRCEESDFKKVVNRIEIPLSAYKPYVFWKKNSYTRNCIHRSDDYELILLCWDANAETPIHCHNSQECWVFILEGEFQEIRFHDKSDGLQKDNELELIQEGISYMSDDMGFHKLINSTAERAMSLHLYRNPIDECNVYDSDLKVFEKRALEYFSFKGEVIAEIIQHSS